MCGFGEREHVQSSTCFFAEGRAWSQGADMIMKDFSAFLCFQVQGDARIGLIKPAPENTDLKTRATCFPGAQKPRFCSAP